VGAPEEDRAGKAPMTIFVLDLLDSTFEDFAYIRFRVRRYLEAQPDELASPAEMMVLGNDSLEMVQGYTRSKADLLYALDHVPPSIPYKLQGSFRIERFLASIDALQQIALQNYGMPGRKNIVWVGHGGPNMYTGDPNGCGGKADPLHTRHDEPVGRVAHKPVCDLSGIAGQRHRRFRQPDGSRCQDLGRGSLCRIDQLRRTGATDR
jgi:hypothetical protein